MASQLKHDQAFELQGIYIHPSHFAGSPAPQDYDSASDSDDEDMSSISSFCDLELDSPMSGASSPASSLASSRENSYSDFFAIPVKAAVMTATHSSSSSSSSASSTSTITTFDACCRSSLPETSSTVARPAVPPQMAKSLTAMPMFNPRAKSGRPGMTSRATDGMMSTFMNRAATTGGSMMARSISLPVATQRQLDQQRTVLHAISNNLETQLSSDGTDTPRATQPIAVPASSGSSASAGKATAHSPMRAAILNESWGAQLPPRQHQAEPAAPYPYNMLQAKTPTPPRPLIRSYSVATMDRSQMFLPQDESPSRQQARTPSPSSSPENEYIMTSPSPARRRAFGVNRTSFSSLGPMTPVSPSSRSSPLAANAPMTPSSLSPSTSMDISPTRTPPPRHLKLAGSPPTSPTRPPFVRVTSTGSVRRAL